MYCPFCDLETMCNVSNSGNKFTCLECEKEFSDEIISVSEVI